MKTTVSPNRQKALGVHYTPPALARFVAERLAKRVSFADARLRILDPACGDGILLECLLEALPAAMLGRCDVLGVETDEQARTAAESRLSRFRQAHRRLLRGDFLNLSGAGGGQRSLWESGGAPAELEQAFDLVIANPPYVRTQVLGAAQAQGLAARFGLTGRVDLYHAFLVAMTQMLRPGGALGVITSNRFLTTAGGAAMRGYLARQYEIDEVIDLGDTKLFGAAVLPAVFIGRRRGDGAEPKPARRATFVKVYSHAAQGERALSAGASIFDVLNREKSGLYRVPEGVFKLTRGALVLGSDPTQLWSLTTARESQWLQRVAAASAGLFGDVAAVRVGIKTTADQVFICSDWDALPVDLQPEPEMLHPLLRHEHACRWLPPNEAQPTTRILYPHEVSGGSRRAVDLHRYPKAAAYLELHRERLERRHYVAAAGRRWYEIWVPQDPAGWACPKLVFPDISPEPRFYLDLDGRLVDGDCYWLTLRPNVPPEMLYLLLGVANSALMTRFHDLAFNNKLYSGRRRYITQYVAKYPYPNLESPASRRLVSLVKRGIEAGGFGLDAEARIDALVEEAFGLLPGEVMQ